MEEPGSVFTVKASPLLATPPVLHLDEGLLYFDRYWLEEQQVATDVLALTAVRPTGELADISRLFPPGFEEQRQAAEVALSRGLTVLTGCAGTGPGGAVRLYQD